MFVRIGRLKSYGFQTSRWELPQFLEFREGILLALVADANESYAPPLRHSRVRHEGAVVCGDFRRHAPRSPMPISPLGLSDWHRLHATPEIFKLPLNSGFQNAESIAKIGSSPASSEPQSSIEPGNVTSITVRQLSIEESRQNEGQSGSPLVKCAEPLRLTGKNQVVGVSIDEASGRRLRRQQDEMQAVI